MCEAIVSIFQEILNFLHLQFPLCSSFNPVYYVDHSICFPIFSFFLTFVTQFAVSA